MGTTENVQAWSTTAATNANADTAVNWAEGQDAASVNNSARSMMAAVAKYVDDIGGALTASGTFNALTVTTNQGLSATQLAGGVRLLVKAVSANTSGAVTFAPDGLSPATVKRADGTPLQVGDITVGMFLDLVYNPGTSEWWAANKAGGGDFLTSTQPSAPISNGAPTSFANVILTPGDWDVWGVGTILSGSTLCTAFLVGISTTVNVLGSQAGLALGAALLGAATSILSPVIRVNVSVNTTVYITLQCNFTPGAVSCQASILAQRR